MWSTGVVTPGKLDKTLIDGEDVSPMCRLDASP